MSLSVKVSGKALCKYDYVVNLIGFMQFQIILAMISKNIIRRSTSEFQ